MAVTKILAKSMRLDKLINYIRNGDKTEDEVLVSAINCTPQKAARQMLQTKERYAKEDGVQAYHIIQSFSPEEITPELAHLLGEEFSVQFLPGYEVVIGTHVDKEHIHNHIAFNSVCLKTGRKYTNTFTDYYQGIRRISDELCRQHGLSVIMETGGKGLSYIEWKLHKAGLLTYREMVDMDVQECLSMAFDIGNFYELMEDRGYVIEHHSQYANGESMNDIGINSGDIIIIRQQETAEPGQIIVALVDESSATLKRYYPRLDDQIVELRPENDAFETQIIDLRERAFAIQGIAVKVLKDI